jgi:hypothetical protein
MSVPQSVARQRLGKRVPATTKELLDTVFYKQFV